jgi:hypothetical protein
MHEEYNNPSWVYGDKIKRLVLLNRTYVYCGKEFKLFAHNFKKADSLYVMGKFKVAKDEHLIFAVDNDSSTSIFSVKKNVNSIWEHIISNDGKITQFEYPVNLRALTNKHKDLHTYLDKLSKVSLLDMPRYIQNNMTQNMPFEDMDIRGYSVKLYVQKPNIIFTINDSCKTKSLIFNQITKTCDVNHYPTTAQYINTHSIVSKNKIFIVGLTANSLHVEVKDLFTKKHLQKSDFRARSPLDTLSPLVYFSKSQSTLELSKSKTKYAVRDFVKALNKGQIALNAITTPLDTTNFILQVGSLDEKEKEAIMQYRAEMRMMGFGTLEFARAKEDNLNNFVYMCANTSENTVSANITDELRNSLTLIDSTNLWLEKARVKYNIRNRKAVPFFLEIPVDRFVNHEIVYDFRRKQSTCYAFSHDEDAIFKFNFQLK